MVRRFQDKFNRVKQDGFFPPFISVTNTKKCGQAKVVKQSTDESNVDYGSKEKTNKKDVIIKECYEIEVKDWEVSCHFGINTAPKDLIPGVYWEGSTLILTGGIISPLLDKANRAVIQITANPQLDDHWQPKPTIISAKAIGWMEIPRR